MKNNFDLKNYQENAVDEVTSFLIESKGNAAIVKSPTGSGKTIMATAIIESFSNQYGKDNTVIIWVSEDPILNEQSKRKIVNASDVYSQIDCENVQYQNFTKFNTGKIYFLNYLKLSSDAHLNKGTDRMGGKTLWQRLRNLNDSGAHILLMIDEAHKGTKESSKSEGKSKTIIKRIMDEIPSACILGISATPNNSSKAMRQAGFDVYFHEVDKHDVVSEGMIKEKIVLNFTEKSDELNYELISSSVSEYDSISAKWSRLGIEFSPLMLVQIPNQFESNSTAIKELITYLRESARCPSSGIFHSIPDEGDIVITLDNDEQITVSYINPNEIPDNDSVKFVIFKETLSEGWDCPRAEILLSLKNKKSETSIEQTVGRLLRNPFLNQPGLLLNNPELNKVFVYTNGYSEDTLEHIQKSFSGEVEETNIDICKTEKVELKNELKVLFDSLELKHYVAVSVEKRDNGIIEKIKNVAYSIDNEEGDEFDEFIEDTEEDLASIIVNELQKVITIKDIESLNKSSIYRQEAHIIDEISKTQRSESLQKNIHISYVERRLTNLKVDKWILNDLSTLINNNSFREEFQECLLELNINPDTKNLVLILLYAAHINGKLPVILEKIEQFMLSLFNKHETNQIQETRKIEKAIYKPEEYSEIYYEDPNFDDIDLSDVKRQSFTLRSNKAAYEKFNIQTGYYMSAQQFRIDSTQESNILKSLIDDESITNILRNNPRTGLGIKYRDKSNKNAIFYPDFIAISKKEVILIEPKCIKIDDNFEAKYKETLDWLEDNRNENCQLRSIWYVVVKNKIYKIDIEKEKSMLGAMRSEDAWLEGKIGSRQH